jgi:hypothetical protein
LNNVFDSCNAYSPNIRIAASGPRGSSFPIEI